MDKKRKVYAPFSLTSEAGVGQTPVEGYIDVNQVIYPIVDTGTVNENGKWIGVKSNDAEFIGLSKAESLPNNGEALFPDTNNHPSINCEGFSALQFALKVTAGGNYDISARFGPDTVPFLNLSPVIAGGSIKITDPNTVAFEDLLDDTESMNADAWYIFTIGQTRVLGQNNLQIKVVNKTASTSTVEFAFRRLV